MYKCHLPPLKPGCYRMLIRDNESCFEKFSEVGSIQVLNDAKNWWECKNMHNRVGYVPHTILTVTSVDQFGRRDSQDQEIYSHTKV